jgi:hypothetical protein
MKLELTAEETQLLHRALQSYISELREEIVHTEKHEWRVELHREEEVLKAVMGRLAYLLALDNSRGGA